MTILLGIVGGAIGSSLGWGTITDFSLHSIGLAVLGAVVVLIIYRAISRK